MMKGISECCRFCEERYPACHDSCEKYLDASAKWEVEKKKMRDSLEDPFLIYKLRRKEEKEKRRK